MAKRIRVKVTAQDIRWGIVGDCWSCPLALAISRVTGKTATVDENWIWIENDKKVPTSKIARRFIDRFDAERKVKPHTFYLTLPYLERGANG